LNKSKEQHLLTDKVKALAKPNCSKCFTPWHEPEREMNTLMQYFQSKKMLNQYKIKPIFRIEESICYWQLDLLFLVVKESKGNSRYQSSR
jgi:hypothetical protein